MLESWENFVYVGMAYFAFGMSFIETFWGESVWDGLLFGESSGEICHCGLVGVWMGHFCKAPGSDPDAGKD